MSAADREGLPRVVLRPPEDDPVAVLGGLQRLILAHPVAAQAAFAALIAEGRRFAQTPAGARWQHRLARSPLVQRARAPWDAATLWLLEEDAASVLPSSYVDALFSVAQSAALEPEVERLMQGLIGEASDDPS